MQNFSNIFPKKNRELSFEDLFLVLAGGVVFIGWLVLGLTITQLFFKSLIFIGLLTLAALIFLFLRSYQSIQKPSKTQLITLSFIVAFAIFNALFAHETFEGGRDQGVYANSAVYLSKNHTLKVAQLKNIPGFLLSPDKKTFIPEFHFAYIAHLALYHVFFGIAGIKLANILPVVIGLFSLFLIGKKIANTKVGIFTVLMMATSFIVIWYARRTFSEIYFMALVWFGIFVFLKSYLENRAKLLIIAITSLGLLLFTRLEGLMIFSMFLGTMAFLYLLDKKWRSQFINVIVPTIVVLLLFVFYSLKIQPDYNGQILSTFKKPLSLISHWARTFRPAEEFAESFDYVIDRPTLYIFQVLQAYNLLIPLGLGLIMVLWAVFRIFRHRRQRTRFNLTQPISLLIMTAVIFPTFFELINLTTYHDQPWMLRRFLPTIIPFACLFSSIFLVKFVKTARYLLLFLILGANLIISAPILTFVEFKDILQKEVKEIAQVLPAEANIFYERSSSGRFNIDLSLRFVFNKENIAYNDATEIIEFINQSNAAPVYAIFHADGATNSFLPEGSTELIMEKVFRYQELERIASQQFPSEFITRHTFYGKTPRRIKDISIPLKIVKIKEDFKDFLPDDVLLYSPRGQSFIAESLLVTSHKEWSFSKDRLLLKRGSTGDIRYKGTKPQRLELTYEGDRSEIFATIEDKKEKLEDIVYHNDLLVINLSQIDLTKQYGYYSFSLFPKTSDLLITKIEFKQEADTWPVIDAWEVY